MNPLHNNWVAMVRCIQGLLILDLNIVQHKTEIGLESAKFFVGKHMSMLPPTESAI
jgi:hypothetical protein